MNPLQDNNQPLSGDNAAKAPYKKTKLSLKERRLLLKQYRRDAVSREYIFSRGIKGYSFGYNYHESRKNGLSVFESFYNAVFIHSLRKFDKSQKHVTDELANTFSHPKGWYGDSFYVWKNNFWSRFLELLQRVPHAFSAICVFFAELPSRIAVLFNAIVSGTDNSFRLLVNIYKITKRIALVILPVICAIPMAGYAMQKLSDRVALDVYVNGQHIGAVISADSIISSKRMLEKNLSSAIGDTYRFTDEITYSFVSGKELEYLSDSQIYSALYDIAKKDIRPAYGLYVDGVLVAATENRSVLDRAVNDIKEYFKESASFYAEEENIRVSYANNINIIPKDFHIDYLQDENRIREVLGLAPVVAEEFNHKTIMYELYYKTVGHAASKIESDAPKNVTGMGASTALSEEAADVMTSTLTNASVDVTIDYVLTKTEEVEEEYPYEITRIESELYLMGSEKLETFGKNGFRKALYEISYQNGEEIGRELISEEIIRPAEPRIIYVGTRIPSPEEAATTATGTFILPYDGTISSRYGLRTVRTFGTREFHNAWDIPGPYGSKIFASDGGVVSEVGRTSGYGLYVMINHENGYETMYAHLSSATVKKGERVGQGDVIARMGASGRVTGVHVHFEIRKDGATIDPIQFIPDAKFKY